MSEPRGKRVVLKNSSNRIQIIAYVRTTKPFHGKHNMSIGSLAAKFIFYNPNPTVSKQVQERCRSEKSKKGDVFYGYIFTVKTFLSWIYQFKDK